MGKFARYKEQAILFFEENGFVFNGSFNLEKKLSSEIDVDLHIKNKSEVNIWFIRKNMENANGFRETNKAYVHFTLPYNNELILKICNSYESFSNLFDIKQIIRFRYIKTIQENKAKIIFMNEDDKIIINCDNDIEVVDFRFNWLKRV